MTEKSIEQKQCANCFTTKTPQWRKDLCNACSLRLVPPKHKRRHVSSISIKKKNYAHARHLLLPQTIAHTLSESEVYDAYLEVLHVCR